MTSQALPLAPEDRYETLDVLRGAALFGVLLMNFVWFTQGLMSTEAQMLALPTVGVDAVVRLVCNWLVGDKANTLFAFLFGLGFSIQMQRLEARGVALGSIYLRRLMVLLGIGVLHLLFVWTWDILHLYALAGFALFALRNASDRVLLGAGIPLALFARPLQSAITDWLGLAQLPQVASLYTEETVLARQALSAAGDYAGLLENFTRYLVYDYFVTGLFVGWLGYALGRFLIGHWVGRRAYLSEPQQYLPGFRRLLRVALPAGLIIDGIASLLSVHRHADWMPIKDDTIGILADTVHLVGVPALACGYLCAIVVGLHTQRVRTWLLRLAPVGRMALTNYLTQSAFHAYVLFGVGPGLALAGRLGTSSVVLIVLLAFAAQIVFSHWWLAHFRFGPAEWLWRALTYGTLPPMRSIPRPVIMERSR